MGPVSKKTGTKSDSSSGEASPDELKNDLLRVARKHFAQQGFQGASLKEIAAEAGVANSLIHYHFTDKAGLFRSCMELFARSRMEAINRILGEPSSREEMRVRLLMFVEEMLRSIQQDPHGFEIIDREVRAANPMVLQVFQETMLQAFNNVVAFFQQAQERGLLKTEMDPIIVAIMLFSSTCDSARKNHLAKRFFNMSFEDPAWSAKFAQHVVFLFMNGVIK